MLTHIFECVQPNDLENLRATCRRFDRAASDLFALEFLAHRRHVMSIQSITALEELASHSYFGRFVQSVAFNCVRNIPSDALDEEDIYDPIPPLQVSPEESREELCSKETKIRNVTRSIHKNLGKISLGVYFENDEDGLIDMIWLDEISLSTDRRSNFSIMHLRNTLRLLLQICTESCCPVDRIEVDLGGQTAVCTQMARNWDFGDEQTPTVFHDIEETLTDRSVPGPIIAFEYGADDSRYQTFSYDQTCKTLKMYNSPLHHVTSPPSLALFVSPLRALGVWLADARIETLDLTGAGNCITSASSLRNVYLTPCYQSLKHLKLHRMQMKSHSTWKAVVESISHFSALEIRQLSSLNSFELSADGSQKTRFFEVIVFEAQGCELKRKLLDLATRLEIYGAAWRNEALGSPTKWADDLGAKVDSRADEEEKATPLLKLL
jgi:hypothetical protein